MRPRKGDPEKPLYGRYSVSDADYGTADQRLADALRSQGMSEEEALDFISKFDGLGMQDYKYRAVGESKMPFLGETAGRYSPEGRMYKDPETGKVMYQEIKRTDKKGNPVYRPGVGISSSNLADIIGVDDLESLPTSVRKELVNALSDPAAAAYFSDIYGSPVKSEAAFTIDPGAFRKGLNRNANQSSFGESAQQKDLRKSTPGAVQYLLERRKCEAGMSDSCRAMKRSKRGSLSLAERLEPIPGTKRALRRQRQSGGQSYSPGILARLGLSSRYNR